MTRGRGARAPGIRGARRNRRAPKTVSRRPSPTDGFPAPVPDGFPACSTDSRPPCSRRHARRFPGVLPDGFPGRAPRPTDSRRPCSPTDSRPVLPDGFPTDSRRPTDSRGKGTYRIFFSSAIFRDQDFANPSWAGEKLVEKAVSSGGGRAGRSAEKLCGRTRILFPPDATRSPFPRASGRGGRLLSAAFPLVSRPVHHADGALRAAVAVRSCM